MLNHQAGRIIFHAFEFDAPNDSPHVKIIDYRYGTSRTPTASNIPQLRAQGKSLQATSIMGDMLRGDDLYVKWEDVATGQIHEQTVDLRKIPDVDIRNHTIYFIVDEAQLFVYIISIQPVHPILTPNADQDLLNKANGPRERKLFMYVRHEIKEIYPQQKDINPLEGQGVSG